MVPVAKMMVETNASETRGLFPFVRLWALALQVAEETSCIGTLKSLWIHMDSWID